MPASGQPDLSTAEIAEWELQGKEGRTRVRVAEGATLEVRTVIGGVFRVGNDPITGLPRYNVNIQNVVSLVNCDKKLRKPVLKQPGKDEGAPGIGVT